MNRIAILLTLFFNIIFALASHGHAGSWDSGKGYQDPAKITFPKDFFVEKISGKSCSKSYPGKRYKRKIKYVAELSDISTESMENQSTSLTVQHDYISQRWAVLLDLVTTAVNDEDKEKIASVKDLLLHLANNRALLGAAKLKKNSQKCWKNNDPNSPCSFHYTQHASFAFISFIISAIVIEEHFDKHEIQILDGYFQEAYQNFISPVSRNQIKGAGIYEFAGNGIGILAYAHWTKDEKLARAELKNRYKNFNQNIEDTGYINNNSYRGYRGYWYHTMGAEVIFGYSMIARNFGVNFFKHPVLEPKFENLANRTVAGNDDVSIFNKLPRKGKNFVAKENARPHMHQLAKNLPLVLEKEFRQVIERNYIYERAVRSETGSRFVGFSADCYYQSSSNSGVE